MSKLNLYPAGTPDDTDLFAFVEDPSIPGGYHKIRADALAAWLAAHPSLSSRYMLLDVAPMARPTVLLVGDSITNQCGTPDTLNQVDSYAARGFFNWATWLMADRYKVAAVRGIGGETATGLAARIVTELTNYPSDWVVVETGANSVAQRSHLRHDHRQPHLDPRRHRRHESSHLHPHLLAIELVHHHRPQTDRRTGFTVDRSSSPDSQERRGR